MKAEQAFNLMDFREGARRRLPLSLFHYIDGGADDEWSLSNNTAAFDKYELQPEYLRNVETINLKTKLLGSEMAMPVFLFPTGMTRLFHHDKELAVSRAAERAGVMYTLSTMGTTSLEDIAKTTSGPKMFQIYIFKDRELTRELVRRCKDAGYLTVDTPLAGNRERDMRSGMVMPRKLTLSSCSALRRICIGLLISSKTRA